MSGLSIVVREVVELHAMQTATELGNYAEAHAFGDRSPSSPRSISAELTSQLDSSWAVDAVGAIAKLAQQETFVLINEAHHVPQHRALTIELLYALRSEGFTHFAAETLLESDKELNSRGYPTRASGTYTAEPIHGDLVRTALALGYELIPYEGSDQHGDRELGQATKLIARTLGVSEGARVVVHAGYDHINEQSSSGGARKMAQHLKTATGHDPLTVDQTLMTEHSAQAHEHPLYRRLVEGLSLDRPTVFLDESGKPWSAQPGVRDVTLLHPRTVLKDGRPTWLRMNGLRRPYPLPADVCEDELSVQVEARLTRESADAIPVDRIEVLAGKKPQALLLGTGHYEVVVRGVQDSVLSSWEIEIP